MTRSPIIALGLALAFLIVPQMVYAQQKPARIGTLLSGSPKTHQHYLDWFRAGMRDLGYIEGKSFVLVSRWGMGRRGALPRLANELVRSRVDLILVNGTPSTRAARDATQSIPIVVGVLANMVKAGFIKSLANPSGNITGSTFDRDRLNGKRLQLLKEALPQVRRVGFLFYPSKRNLRDLKRTEVASRALGLEIQPLPVKSLEDIKNAFHSMGDDSPEGLLVPTSSLTNFYRKQIARLAIDKRVPTACNQASHAKFGCMIAYAADREYMMRRAAAFVDRILKGARPAELPVELSTKYRVLVNLKTARAIGIKMPPSVLLQATEVIE